MLLVSTLAGLIVLVPAARWFAKRANGADVNRPEIASVATHEEAAAMTAPADTVHLLDRGSP
jgi:hypothetical protein